MTAQTRRRVFFCAVVVALTLPGEWLLVRAIQTPDAQVAVQQWAVGLPPESLEAAAGAVDQYPLRYRKAILKALPPGRRVAAWTGYVDRYAGSHPSLDATALALLDELKALITPATLSTPTEETRAEIHALADRITAALGRGVAEELMYALGPRDGTFASIEPMGMRLTNYLRERFAAFAADPDCDCNMYWGCYDWTTHCTDRYKCVKDDEWPMCGWLWDDICDGLCTAGI